MLDVGLCGRVGALEVSMLRSVSIGFLAVCLAASSAALGAYQGHVLVHPTVVPQDAPVEPAPDPAAKPVGQFFKLTLQQHGLGHLSPEDMAKVEEMVTANTPPPVPCPRAGRTGPVFSPVDPNGVGGYLESEGFVLESLRTTRIDGKEAVVVGSGYEVYTVDVPLTLNTYGLRPGRYYVKRSFMGISELIADGQLHRFFLAQWHRLP